MSDYTPTKAYVYQPDADDGLSDSKIFGVSGPKAEKYWGMRFTKSEAQKIVNELNKETPNES